MSRLIEQLLERSPNLSDIGLMKGAQVLLAAQELLFALLKFLLALLHAHRELLIQLDLVLSQTLCVERMGKKEWERKN